MIAELQQKIEAAWDNRQLLSYKEYTDAIETVIQKLDLGEIRVAEPIGNRWHVNDWIKRRELGIGGRPYTCERANSAGVGCGECSLEKKNKWVKIGDKYVETQEQSSPSPVRFAYKLMDKGGEHA
jgi:tetrahydrodipicolinate N-succinyltransferase